MTAKLELYRVFREVAETGNYFRGAEPLHFAVRGEPERQAARGRLTDAAVHPLPARRDAHGRRADALQARPQRDGPFWKRARKSSRRRAPLQMGKLVIGASDTVTSQFLLPHLDSFHKKYPNIHIQIISGAATRCSACCARARWTWRSPRRRARTRD